LLSRFPVVFRRAGILLLGPSCSRRRVPLSLRSAYQDRRPGLRRGFHVPHGRDPTGKGALSTPGHGVPTTSGGSLVAVAASQQQPYPPTMVSIFEGFSDEASAKSSLAFTRPVFPLPVIPGWSGNPWAFPWCFEPRRCQRRTPRVETDHEHSSGIHYNIQFTSNQ
jgi:hypothetical protein